MNRTAVKNFAQWGRRHLHDLVRARLASFGVTDKGIETATRLQGGLIVAGQTLTLSGTDIGQYDALLRHYAELSGTPKEKYALLVDEAGYTWFNRLAALRFMEVRGYTGRSLSSSTEGSADPDLLRDALALSAGGELPDVTPDKLTEWQRLYQPGEVYRRLLVARSAALEGPLPFLFGRGKPWLDLFLPDNLLNQDSLVRRMVNDIPEEDWQDIEIVGWLYQFYISERKDEVFAQKGKYTPRDIPAATQLFTPHWIVRYMVENSLGRVWLEAHPESTLREHMPYYLESENPALPANSALMPEELSVMDPACGSGHILVYAFDLLAHIYRERGYAERDIPALIVQHNLHGLDIDERAAQLASFAVMMKARELNSRLFRKPPSLNILQVTPTRALSLPRTTGRDLFGNHANLSGGLTDADAFNPNDWQPLLDAFADADHLGSLITPPEFDDERLRAQLAWLERQGGFDAQGLYELQHLLKQADLLVRKYDAVVANPPYMAINKFDDVTKEYVQKKYVDVKTDLFSVYVVRNLEMSKDVGHLGFMTPFVWMFISSYEDMRNIIINKHTITSLVQLEYSGFEGATVPICTFTLMKGHDNSYPGQYIRLSDFRGAENQGPKVLEAVQNPACTWRYTCRTQSDFGKIPGSPIAYWASSNFTRALSLGRRFGDLSVVSEGIKTGNNDRFLRLWHEIPYLEDPKWVPHQKGGEYRKWYGNSEYVINWGNGGKYLESFPASGFQGKPLYFKEFITWGKITSSYFSARYVPSGQLFDSGSPALGETRGVELKLFLAILSSKVGNYYVKLVNPTLNLQVGNISRFSIVERTEKYDIAIQEKLVQISKTDWDNFETSWDFTTHPLLHSATPILAASFQDWKTQSESAFRELQRLEEENNRYWIDAYGLRDELTPEAPDNQITIRRANLPRDIRSLLSYVVGNMMGRYSLDTPGLVHVGQPFDAGRHTTFPADADGILPVTLDAYFDDDVTVRFTEFLRVTFAPGKLTENLEYVAAALGGQRAGESAEARIRRYFAAEFVSDHIQTYKKRPIYWLFTSGKKRAFGALVYLHRYDEGTLARLRTDYLLPLQRKLDAELERAKGDLEAATSTPAKKAADKRIKELGEQIVELRAYDEKLRHLADQRISLDLDDGVAYNYWRMRGLVYEGTDLKMADLERKSQWKRDLLAAAEGQSLDRVVEA